MPRVSVVDTDGNAVEGIPDNAFGARLPVVGQTVSPIFDIKPAMKVPDHPVYVVHEIRSGGEGDRAAFVEIVLRLRNAQGQ